ncbi:MAG: lamin tail domain-containing protein [Chloroflexota bacterium]|nr:MAG: lamin tail domain-containing protein [Chloroflexota bacterium]
MDSRRPSSALECWLVRAALVGAISLVVVLILTASVMPAKAGARSRNVDMGVARAASRGLLLPNVRIMTIDADREVVYVINNDGAEVDLTNWRVISRGGKAEWFSFPSGFRLGPSAIVRVHTYGGVDSSGDLYWNLNTYEKVWGERGDTGSLVDAEGRLVSSFSYARW